MKAKLEYLFPRLHADDVLVDKTGARWMVDSWSGTLQINLVPPTEYECDVFHVVLGFFGADEQPCLISADSGAALGAFMGMESVEVIPAATEPKTKEDLDPRCPDSQDNWEPELND